MTRSIEQHRGFTLMEVMVTLIIVIIVSALGFISMSGYIPKQRLITTARYIENILLRAQSEAYSRSERVGVHFRKLGDDIVGELFLDNGSTDYTRDLSEEPALTSMTFRSGVDFVPNGACSAVMTSTATNCDFGASNNCYAFFSSSGEAIDNSGSPADYQLFVYTERLEPGSNAREVELLSSGLVQMLKQSQTGDATPPTKASSCVP